MLCRLFRTTPEQLGLRIGLASQPDPAERAAASLFEPTMTIVDRMRRAGSSNVSDKTLDQFERMTGDVVGEYERLGPALLAPRLVKQRGWIEALFDGRQTRLAARRATGVTRRLACLAMSREQEHVSARRAAFERLDMMRDHWWWRPGWRVGRSFYTFHVTFERSPEVAALAAHYRQALDLSGLDAVPDEGLHLTVQGVGFTDEVTDQDLAAVVDAARGRCAALAPFAVTLGPADADPEAVMLQVAPWRPLDELRTSLRAAICDVWGADQVPEAAEGFTPHVSVAYSGSTGPAEPIRQRLAEIEAQSSTTTVDAVQLIVLNRDERIYRWSTVATSPFGETKPQARRLTANEAATTAGPEHDPDPAPMVSYDGPDARTAYNPAYVLDGLAGLSEPFDGPSEDR